MTNPKQRTRVESRPRKLPVGSTFVPVYLCLIAAFIAASMLEAPKTEFSGVTARQFSVALIPANPRDPDQQYNVATLQDLREHATGFSQYTFLLPQPSIEIDNGDRHRAEILEYSGDSQLVAFHYSNTRTSTSIYRAHADHIEPVSHEVTSSVGQVFTIMVLSVPALIVSLLISLSYNRLVARKIQ